MSVDYFRLLANAAPAEPPRERKPPPRPPRSSGRRARPQQRSVTGRVIAGPQRFDGAS